MSHHHPPHRDFLNIADFSPAETFALLDLAERMRTGAYDRKPLLGKALAMIFMKSSTRTRVSFEVGVTQLGGTAHFLSPRDVQLGRGWSLGYTPALATYAFDPSVYGSLRVLVNNRAMPFAPAPRITAFSQQASVSTPQFRRFAASASVLRSRDVDFNETSRVNRTAYSGSVDWRPNTRLRVNATFASNEFVRRVDDVSTFSTQIPRVKAEYQVSRWVFVRLITQYEANRRETLRDWRTGSLLYTRRSDGSLTPTVATRSNVLRADWLFSFRPSPGTVLFAGYGSSLTEPEALGLNRLRRVNDSFFLKASWVNRLGAR